MRRLLLALFLILPFATMADSSYTSQINKCDNMAKQDLSQPENYSNVRMLQITDTQTECYKSVAMGIIEKSYAQNAKSMVAEFNDFCEAAQKLSRTTMYPDSCAPQCGTIAGLQAAALYREMVLNYLNSLIKAVNPEMH